MLLLINSIHFPHVYLFQCNRFDASLNQSLKLSCLPEAATCLSTCTASAGFLLGLTWGTIPKQELTWQSTFSFLLQEWCLWRNIRGSCARDLTASLIPTKIMQLHFIQELHLTYSFSTTWVSSVQNPLPILKHTVEQLHKTTVHFLLWLVYHKQTAPWEISATEPKVKGVSSPCQSSAATQNHCYLGCQQVWSGWHRSPPPPPQAGKLCDGQLGGPSCCLLLPKSFLGRSAACHHFPPPWIQLLASQEVKAGARSISLSEGTSEVGTGLQLVRVASVFPQYITFSGTC